MELDKKLKYYAKRYGAIGNERRWTILLALHVIESHSNNSSFTQLKDMTELDSPTLAYHLKVLKDADLITRELAEDRKTYYRLTPDAKNILEHLEKQTIVNSISSGHY